MGAGLVLGHKSPEQGVPEGILTHGPQRVKNITLLQGGLEFCFLGRVNGVNQLCTVLGLTGVPG